MLLNWKMNEIFVSHKQVISVFDMKSMYFYGTVLPTSNVFKILNMTSPTFFFFGGVFCKFNHIIFVVLLYSWANIKKCYKCNINRSKEQRVLPSIPQLKWVTLLLV